MIIQSIAPHANNANFWEDLIFNQFSLLEGVMFAAHAAHESNDFNSLEENLNYSPQAIARVFGHRISIPHNYAHNPEKLGNKVYSNRLGNGPNEGFKFRGRGLFQLTGRTNYENFFQRDPTDQDLDFLTTPAGAFESAVWYWETHNLPRPANLGHIYETTRIINGGLNGIEDRKRKFYRGCQAAKLPFVGLGSSGYEVGKLQAALNIPQDGIFGPQTEAKLNARLNSLGLHPSGQINPGNKHLVY